MIPFYKYSKATSGLPLVAVSAAKHSSLFLPEIAIKSRIASSEAYETY